MSSKTENELLSSIEGLIEQDSHVLLKEIIQMDGAVECNLTDILHSVYKNKTAVLNTCVLDDSFGVLEENIHGGNDAYQLKCTATQFA